MIPHFYFFIVSFQLLKYKGVIRKLLLYTIELNETGIKYYKEFKQYSFKMKNKMRVGKRIFFLFWKAFFKLSFH
jgi:hypothetical protein